METSPTLRPRPGALGTASARGDGGVGSGRAYEAIPNSRGNVCAVAYGVPVSELSTTAVDLSPEASVPASPPAGRSLTLGHLLTGMGGEHDPVIGLENVLLIRHAFRPGDHGSLQGPEDLSEEKVLAYTREQGLLPRQFPADPPRYWVILVADGQRRSRLWGVFENGGEVAAERTETARFFDLKRSEFLGPLNDRLVVDWNSPRNWQRRAASAANLPVLEIADRDKVPFPGFDGVLLTYHQLCEMIDDHRYVDWRAALKEVQGIYLITDSTNGKQYVGKADGAERILARWTSYARDGHGGNVALRELAYDSTAGEITKTGHARNFVFSLLRVFGPSTPSSEVDRAESHYKEALMTRRFGLNRN